MTRETMHGVEFLKTFMPEQEGRGELRLSAGAKARATKIFERLDRALPQRRRSGCWFVEMRYEVQGELAEAALAVVELTFRDAAGDPLSAIDDQVLDMDGSLQRQIWQLAEQMLIENHPQFRHNGADGVLILDLARQAVSLSHRVEVVRYETVLLGASLAPAPVEQTPPQPSPLSEDAPDAPGP